MNAIENRDTRRLRGPWRADELQALQAARIQLVDPDVEMAGRAQTGRWPVLAAKRRCVLVLPARGGGASFSPPAVYDELHALLGGQEALASVTLDSEDLLAGRVAALGGARPPSVERLLPLALPKSRSEWAVPQGLINLPARRSFSEVDTLLGCGLRWTLGRQAGIRDCELAAVPEMRRLLGTLGHRLVEELHHSGAFAFSAEAFDDRARALIGELIDTEGALLRESGQRAEAVQSEEQLLRAARALRDLLVRAGLQIVGVEEALETTWRGAPLYARLDVRAQDISGQTRVLDLKWGASGYRDDVTRGEALQLALYAHAVRGPGSRLPPSGYFSLSRAELISPTPEAFGASEALDPPPPLEETLRHAETMLEGLEGQLVQGRVLVASPTDGPTMEERLGVPTLVPDAPRRGEAKSPCTYCTHAAVCGERWRDLA
jgi:hypothetical protein